MGRRGRPIEPTDDPRLARRRAQYRNAKRRKFGKPEDPVPDGPVRPINEPLPVGRYVRSGKYVRQLKQPCACKRSVWMGDKGWVPVTIDDQGRRVFA